jgi:hypothetical protein
MLKFWKKGKYKATENVPQDGRVSFEHASEHDNVERPAYAFIVLKAAWLAKSLGHSKVSVIEFGVAGGNGLVLLEEYARRVEEEYEVEIRVIGFDTGKGMPKPKDPRDLPYLWFEGDFCMDETKLKEKLGESVSLQIGEVKDTVEHVDELLQEFPVGGIVFDLDYYSSTLEAFKIFDKPENTRLPRVISLLDNVKGRAEFPINIHVGELAAVETYNQLNAHKKIGQINYLRHKRKKPSAWNDQIYLFQDFEHSKYAEPVREKRNWKTQLK